MLAAKTVESAVFNSWWIFLAILVQHITYQNYPQSLLVNLIAVISHHMTRMTGEVTRFPEYVRHGISTNQLVKE